MVVMAITTIVDNDERLHEGYLHTSRDSNNRILGAVLGFPG